MIYILPVIAVSIIAVYFFARYRLLCKSIKKTDMTLQAIIQMIEENQILKLAVPGKEMEGLLVTINRSLENVRHEHIRYLQREKELKKQIEDISHDLRTPLTSMIGYLKMIEKENLNQEDQQSLEVVIRKSYFLERLLSQFYDISRLTADGYELKIESIDIGRILKETIVDHYQEFAIKNLQLDMDISAQAVYAWGNMEAMERVVSNLIQNACRYGKSKLKIYLEVSGDAVVINFENNVEDFGEKDVDKIFGRFYTVDNARSQGSTGLGLTISKSFMEKMGGGLSASLIQGDDEEWLQITMTLKG